eukprot:m.433573 g.433573  ORF g.433573 m.433573 type:complete len:66 (-) comp17588_c0_seq1:141-338(-)
MKLCTFSETCVLEDQEPFQDFSLQFDYMNRRVQTYQTIFYRSETRQRMSPINVDNCTGTGGSFKG